MSDQLLTGRNVKGSDPPVQQQLIHRVLRARIPVTNFLIEMPADDVHAAVANEIVAAGAGEDGLDACSTPEVPDFQGAVVAARYDAVGAGEEFASQNLAGMPRECVLEWKMGENILKKVRFKASENKKNIKGHTHFKVRFRCWLNDWTDFMWRNSLTPKK